ncbi:NAD(P)H-dependent glycerol-3-phosphate dehydrogenase [Thiohalobacter sp. IOR34]|uniref:NAD(P)H-dependent glycerol-3-phosphate dehydrogenase n=1 Tax=Thiohalobacter sp. IOR34 TaxID=3057176 RepID=UPI0025B0217A|nr:NAD(P)H-dependent glycerol-3-phosphate dehydrogenase [Thiohalobacter sp. IOR34]WJW75543.1 NAD(P)H-dependent glycerol-3-phosphate dehydrogenase [Thiohalobacter sp. IOR34]
MAAEIAVFGAGSWGTALAILLARNGHRVRLWGHLEAEIAVLRQRRENPEYLPGIRFPEGIEPTSDLAAALGCPNLLVVVPSHAFREVLRRIAERLEPGHRLAWATKGLEMASGKLLHQVAAEELGTDMPRAVISGPTFAREVAAGLPTAATVAADDPATAAHFADLLRGETFRAYTSDDIVGLELGGAIKNVLAIAAGISDGLGFGANSRAALITRGLAEMMRLGEALGGRRETFMGLGGVGDLVLTCTDDQSRNRRLGLALGQGRSREAAEREIRQVVEGADTAREIHKLGKARNVEMPICEEVYRVLYEGLPPQQAVHDLLAREPKAETA